MSDFAVASLFALAFREDYCRISYEFIRPYELNSFKSVELTSVDLIF